jgi:hypothetical protein
VLDLQAGPLDIVIDYKSLGCDISLSILSDLDLPFSRLDPESLVDLVPVRDSILIMSASETIYPLEATYIYPK